MSDRSLLFTTTNFEQMRLGSLTQFKIFTDIADRQEDQKELIRIRQLIKINPIVKWRKAKLRWVIKLIKSLETTTKSRGGRQLRGLNIEESP